MPDLTPTWRAARDALANAIDLLPLFGREKLRQHVSNWCDLLASGPPPVGVEAYASTPKDFGGATRLEVWLLWRRGEHDMLVVLGSEGHALIFLGRSREGYPYHLASHPADLQAFLAGHIEPRPTPPIHFLYRNHRGEIARRYVSPLSIRFGSSEHHSAPTWLLDAHDLDRDELRTFVLADINRAIGYPMPCGHPEACRIWETGPHTFMPSEPEPEYRPTARCGWCEDVARRQAALLCDEVEAILLDEEAHGEPGRQGVVWTHRGETTAGEMLRRAREGDADELRFFVRTGYGASAHAAVRVSRLRHQG